MAENFERVLGLRPGAVSVMMEEGKELTACSINPVPHVHYAVTIGYDDKNTLEAAAAEALKP